MNIRSAIGIGLVLGGGLGAAHFAGEFAGEQFRAATVAEASPQFSSSEDWYKNDNLAGLVGCVVLSGIGARTAVKNG